MGSVLARDRFSKAQAWPGYTVVVLLIIRYRIYEFEYLATTAATYRRVRRRPAASSAFEGKRRIVLSSSRISPTTPRRFLKGTLKRNWRRGDGAVILTRRHFSMGQLRVCL